MKRKLRILIIGLLPLFALIITLTFWKREIIDEDHYIQIKIDELDFGKEFVIEKNLKHLFDRLEKGITQEGGYKVKFGEKHYFVAKNDESFYQYALENDTLDYYLMIGIRKGISESKGDEISFIIIKKLEDIND